VPRDELEARAGGTVPLACPSAQGRGNAPRTVPARRCARDKQDFMPSHMRMPGYVGGKSGVMVVCCLRTLLGRACAWHLR
jgi:nitrile hydratase subunit beta